MNISIQRTLVHFTFAVHALYAIDLSTAVIFQLDFCILVIIS